MQTETSPLNTLEYVNVLCIHSTQRPVAAACKLHRRIRQITWRSAGVAGPSLVRPSSRDDAVSVNLIPSHPARHQSVGDITTSTPTPSHLDPYACSPTILIFTESQPRLLGLPVTYPSTFTAPTTTGSMSRRNGAPQGPKDEMPPAKDASKDIKREMDNVC